MPSFVLKGYRCRRSKIKGIGRKKKKKLALAAPAEEVTPEKDDAPEVDDEAPDEGTLGMIEALADLALELVVEELINVGRVVELQMRRLHKREVRGNRGGVPCAVRPLHRGSGKLRHGNGQCPKRLRCSRCCGARA